MRVSDALDSDRLERLDCELLLALSLDRDRTWILAHPEYALTPDEAARFEDLAHRREGHEPLAYILGEKEFYGLPFAVNEHTLIPRPETELLVEAALEKVSSIKYQVSKKRIAIVDIGTGSGCIIVSLAKHLLDSEFQIHDTSLAFFAADISSEALLTARSNALRHGVADRITFVHSDLLERVREQLTTFDLLVVLANLPYLSETLYADAAPDVRQFEPAGALVSGLDGLDHYHRLLSELQVLTPRPDIHFFLEISPEQALFVPALLHSHEATLITIRPDLAGKARLVIGRFD